MQGLAHFAMFGQNLREIGMPTRNISLTDKHDLMIRDAIDSGDFKDASEVVREALRLFDRKYAIDVLRMKRLREQADEDYDTWFRAEVQKAIDEADDPNTRMIPHEEIVAEFLPDRNAPRRAA
jgi:antitoxin ParD1/3/4